MHTENTKKRVSEADQDAYKAPDWAKGVVWYQLFPERFRNGDPHNDPTPERIQAPEGWRLSPWTGDWYDRADWEINAGPDFRDGVFDRRYGGDIQGIIDKLDYLQELGIGALYINPVFDAVSLHKYDASYYHHVDRFFGPDPEGDVRIMEQEDPADPSTWQWTSADRLYLELIQKVHDRGMKIIMDGVFNHTGTDFWAFRDVMKKQKASDFKDWYKVISFEEPHHDNGFDYHSWWGIKDLPEFREENGTLYKPVRDHIFAITRRWMDPDGDGDPSDGIDGWRLDVPEEIGLDFWYEWNWLVKSINPEAYTVAEIWTDNVAHFVNAEQFDAVMNYRFADAVKRFLIDENIGAWDFGRTLDAIRNSFPKEANLVVQNLMESHDTPRLASQIVNPGTNYNQGNTSLEGFDVRKPNDHERRIQRLVAFFQYTYIGAPMIYYGTEAGMWGADDPDDRKPMVWPEMEFEPEVAHPLGYERPADENSFDHDLFAWYKLLGKLHNEHPVLQTGKYRELLAVDEKQFFAFMRFFNEEDYAVILINRSAAPQTAEIPLKDVNTEEKTFTELLSGKETTLRGDSLIVEMEPISGAVFMCSR